jgi:hypothetical protein
LKGDGQHLSDLSFVINDQNSCIIHSSVRLNMKPLSEQ